VAEALRPDAPAGLKAAWLAHARCGRGAGDATWWPSTPVKPSVMLCTDDIESGLGYSPVNTIPGERCPTILPGQLITAWAVGRKRRASHACSSIPRCGLGEAARSAAGHPGMSPTGSAYTTGRCTRHGIRRRRLIAWGEQRSGPDGNHRFDSTWRACTNPREIQGQDHSRRGRHPDRPYPSQPPSKPGRVMHRADEEMAAYRAAAACGGKAKLLEALPPT